jgi:ankyrin repeat protein
MMKTLIIALIAVLSFNSHAGPGAAVRKAAAKCNESKIIDILLAVNLVNSPDAMGNAPMHYLAPNMANCSPKEVWGTFVTLKEIFDANLSAKNLYGQTPLMMAVAQQNWPFIHLALSSQDASIDAQDREGLTALHIAVIQNDKNAITTLLKHKANPNLLDKLGRSPLTYAVDMGFREIADLLQTRNSNTTQSSIARH